MKLLIVLTLLSLMLINGCTLPKYYEITLEDNTQLNCTDFTKKNCGLTLSGCNTGVTYQCVTNAKTRRVMD